LAYVGCIIKLLQDEICARDLPRFFFALVLF
jgi:hypothetical protein